MLSGFRDAIINKGVLRAFVQLFLSRLHEALRAAVRIRFGPAPPGSVASLCCCTCKEAAPALCTGRGERNIPCVVLRAVQELALVAAQGRINTAGLCLQMPPLPKCQRPGGHRPIRDQNSHSSSVPPQPCIHLPAELLAAPLRIWGSGAALRMEFIHAKRPRHQNWRKQDSKLPASIRSTSQNPSGLF